MPEATLVADASYVVIARPIHRTDPEQTFLFAEQEIVAVS